MNVNFTWLEIVLLFPDYLKSLGQYLAQGQHLINTWINLVFL